jgi:hypothetical protein
MAQRDLEDTFRHWKFMHRCSAAPRGPSALSPDEVLKPV